MGKRIEYITGHRFDGTRLTFICEMPPYRYVTSSGRSQSYRKAKFLCDCGNETVAMINNIRRQTTVSCGCYLSEHTTNRNLIHGNSRKRLHNIWDKMIRRCNDVNCDSYQYYGAIGVDVCDEWQDYDNFEKWAITNDYDVNLSIDRHNNYSIHYEPLNCRWATIKEQNQNVRGSYWWIVRGKLYGSGQDAANFNKVSKQKITKWCDDARVGDCYRLPKYNGIHKNPMPII